jgi:hypothetical protein
VSGLTELFVIGAVVAFVGAVLGFVLVRQRDFIAPAHEGAAAVPAV